MGKAPLILKYLQDHARLVCDRRNEKDGPGTWKITSIPDDHRKNIIFHYGSTENYEEFFSNKAQHQHHSQIIVSESPTLNYCEINLKCLERREMMRMTEKKMTKDSRITLKRNTQDQKPRTGIFSNGIQSNNRILIPQQQPINYSDNKKEFSNHQSEIFINHSIPSTSSIYLESHESSDYEDDLFKEPNDMDLAQFHHQKSLNNTYYGGQDDDWFYNTANFTQSQKSSKRNGFVSNHPDYYRFNSQR